MRKELSIAAIMMMQSVQVMAAVPAKNGIHQPVSQSASARARLGKLEQSTFGTTHEALPIVARLESLEREILGTTYPSEDLTKRLVRLEALYGASKKNEPVASGPSRGTPGNIPIAPALTAGTVKADVAGVLADAVTAYDKKQIAKAKELFEKVLELEPTNADANFSLGCIAEDRGDLVVAQKYYQTAHAATPQDAEIAEAVKVIKSKIEQQSAPKQTLGDDVSKAITEYRAGNYGSAKAALEKILSVKPRSDRAHFALGECLRHLGDTRGAIAHLREALRINPNDSTYKEGLARLTSGKDPEVFQRDPSRRLGEIIPIDASPGVAPRRVDSISWEARNLVTQAHKIIDGFLTAQQSNSPVSIEAFKHGLNNIRRLSPDAAAESLDEGSTYHSRGKRAAQQGLVADALADYRKAFSLNPWDASETLDLVQLEMDERKWNTAEQYCMAAIACQPTIVEGWANLGIILAYKHDYPKAATCFSIADMESGDTGLSSRLLDGAIGKADDPTVKEVLQNALRRSRSLRRLRAIGITFLPNPETPDPAFVTYRSNLLLELANYCESSAVSPSSTILVTRINKEGQLIDNDLVKSSGDNPSDERAISLVKSVKLEPLPSWYSAPNRSFIINFDKVKRLMEATH